MKYFIFWSLLLITCTARSQSRQDETPASLTKALARKGLDKDYAVDHSLKPAFLAADFNGDRKKDTAIQITDKKTGKKGLLILHAGSRQYFVLGAGKAFGNGSDDFKWATEWQLYTKNTVSETRFKSNGDLIGGKTIRLERPGILIFQKEDGALVAGAVIYWTGKKYRDRKSVV